MKNLPGPLYLIPPPLYMESGVLPARKYRAEVKGKVQINLKSFKQLLSTDKK